MTPSFDAVATHTIYPDSRLSPFFTVTPLCCVLQNQIIKLVLEPKIKEKSLRFSTPKAIVEMGKNKSKKTAQLAQLEDDQKFKHFSNAGNQAFLNGEIHQSIQCYNHALEIRPHETSILSNRGAALLRVRSFETALKDFSMVVEQEYKNTAPPVKTIIGYCNAKWALKQYDDTMFIWLRKHGKWFNDNKRRSEFEEIQKLMKASLRMQCESMTGVYNMASLVQRQQQVYNCGEYHHHQMEIHNLPGKGHSVVAMSTIRAGSIILGCKAIAIVFPRPQAQSTITERDDWKVNNFEKLSLIIQDMLKSNSNLARAFNTLSCNKDDDDDDEKNETNIEIEQLNSILQSKGIICASNPYPCKSPNPIDIDDRISQNTYGFWLLPSYINYRCVDVNADIQHFGDMAIVRASKDIPRGAEIVVSHPRRKMIENESYSAELEESNIMCGCRLCTLEKDEPITIKQKRKHLLKLAKVTEDEDLEAIEMQLEDLRPNHPDLNFSIFWICRKIALYSQTIGMYRKAVCYFEKAYDLTACFGLSRQRIRLAIEICLCYIKVRDDAKAREWGGKLGFDLITTYGRGHDKTLLEIIIRTERMEIDITTKASLAWYCYDSTQVSRAEDQVKLTE